VAAVDQWRTSVVEMSKGRRGQRRPNLQETQDAVISSISIKNIILGWKQERRGLQFARDPDEPLRTQRLVSQGNSRA
jgi:hypothetical protein